MAELRLLVDGRGLVESPRWHDGRWYVSDWSAGEVIAVDAGGQTEVVARVDSLPLCTAFLPDGSLVCVSSPQGRLLRRSPDGTLTTYAELGHPGWNDMVIDGHGNAYVNGAGYDTTTHTFTPGGITLVTADRAISRQADDIAFPNGMAVTADNATLLVADSHRHQLLAFDISADGSLSGRRIWADLGDGAPDGICVDVEDACWYADVPHQRCVRVAEGGAVLESIALDRGGFACVLGGPDRTTLGIVGASFKNMAEGVATGSGRLWTIEVDVPGAGWP